MSYFKNNSTLLSIDPQPEEAVKVASRAPDQVSAAARVYNRIGRLLDRLCQDHQIEVASVIAVWLVQADAQVFFPGRAQLHFEVEKFFEVWGHLNRQEFDTYFKFGGHNAHEGCGWENHQYREDPTGRFQSVHHNRNSDYAALTMARMLAGDALALTAATIGGCLISAGEHSWLGYNCAIEMFEAFQDSERVHVLGFFDYCMSWPAPKSADLLRYLKTHDWVLFGTTFPAYKQTPLDPERLREAYASAMTMIRHATPALSS